MRAICQHAFGGPEELRYETVPDPQPGRDQVRIAVTVAGVHLLDTVIRSGGGGPRTAPTLPMTPGREVAGAVDRLGPGVPAGLLGRRVVADLGLPSGGYAELALAPVSALHEIPHDVADGAAVAALGTGRTTLAVLEAARVASGDHVIVTGAAGGVGSMLIAAATRAGARTIGVVTGATKTDHVRRLGGVPIDHGRSGWRDRLAAELPATGATLLLDGVGGELGTALLDRLGVGGRLVMFGTAAGRPVELTAQDVFARGICVTAAVGARLLQRPGGLRPLEVAALGAVARGELTAQIGARYPLARAADAHRAVEARTTIGKTLLVTG